MDNYTLDTTTMTGSFSQSFYGGAASPHNGFIYSFPYNDNAILKINPYNNTYSTILSGSFGVTPQRFQGSVLSSYNGSIYGIPRTGSNYIAKFNPITETVNATAIGPFPGTNKFNAGAEGKDGKIYLAPQTFNFIGILDPVTDTLNTTSLTGLTGYNGAVLSQNGYVYMSPGAASNVAIINTDTVTVDTTTIAGLGAGNKFFGIINSPTGEILCVPNGATYSLIIESGIPTIDVGWCTSVYANHY
jgi:hypothetical protein